MYISNDDITRVKQAADNSLIDVIQSYITISRSGKDFVGKCPCCGKEKGIKISPSKGLYKCFSCDFSGKDAVKFVMQSQNVTFPEAIAQIADILNIYIDKNENPKIAKTKDKPKDYLQEFLSGSGLTAKDVEAKVYYADNNKTTTIGRVFRKGTVNNKGDICDGDDVIIEYYDLEGNPVTFEQKIKNRSVGTREYFRVRWHYPDEHLDREGRSMKYRSPVGSGTFIYFPEKIRQMFRSQSHIDTLYIQEGEKKAEKACKHGIPSVAISGIFNIASAGKLSEDLIKLIITCQVNNVVMVYDSDYNDLSREIRISESVDRRPRNFFLAAKNFKEYMRSLKNRDLYLEIYIAYILKNEAGDKGIDDLLTNSLKGKESLLVDDIEKLFNEKNLTGEYMQFHKITSKSDLQLEQIWHLDNYRSFASAHRDILINLPEWKFGRNLWKFDDNGDVVSAEPIDDNEKFWIEHEKEDKKGNITKTVEFNYYNAYEFLQNRGFARLRRQDGNSFIYIKYDRPFIREVDSNTVRDFVLDFAKTFTSIPVINMLMKGGFQYFGPERLSNLQYIQPTFERGCRGQQILYFRNNCWLITPDNISELNYASLEHTAWADVRKDFEARLLDEPLISVTSLAESHYKVNFSHRATNCQFLQFLVNTSNFTWRKKSEEITPEEIQENADHLIAKLCAIGYMITSFKDKSVSRAVVAMDGKQSEVGQSNGRSGKSLIGEMLKHVIPTTYINGKSKSPEDDQFYFDGVVEKTRLVFIDDVRTNFSLEPLFAYITGDFAVNYKGGRRATFPYSASPKIYITTNHAINGNGSSFSDRQWKIAFSDWYNDNHKPTDDFGNLLFDEWDDEQWNLLWNLIATCVQLYFRLGVVQSPSERIETRQLRQFMGETFLAWAEEYFSAECNRNDRKPRKQLFDTYLDYSQEPRKYATPQAFKNKLKSYCEYAGYIFNPQRLDPTSRQPLYYDKDGRPLLDDKRDGVEYFVIGDENYYAHSGYQIKPQQSVITKENPLPFDDEDD